MTLIKEKIKQQNKEEYAYNKMLGYGWTPDQAAGIVGNLKYESGFNTSAEGDIGYKGGSSFGIAQFRGKRLDNLKQKYGSNWKDLDNQLDFVNWELNNTHKKVGDRLRNTQGIYNTGALISDKYEIPSKKFHENKDRQKAVYSVYEKYSGMPFTPEEFKGTAQRAIDNYNPYQETVSQNAPIYTPEISNLVTYTEIPNLAESNETEAVKKAKEELDYKQQQQINQQRFIQELLTASQVQYVDPNQVQQEDIYNQEQYFQRGGSYYDLPMNNPEVLTPEQFTIDYINSPKYKERLINSGYKNPNQVIKNRANEVNGVQIIDQNGKPNVFEKTWLKMQGVPYSTDGSQYHSEINTIVMDNITDKAKKELDKIGYNSVKAHELGHSELKGAPLNRKDQDELFDRLKAYKFDVDLTKEDINDIKNRAKGEYNNVHHDLRPQENKSDLNGLRFLLKKEGIYDAGKENFTKEHLKKVKNNFFKKRLQENYTDENLIWLMNNVAQNEDEGLIYVQNGGEIVKDDNGYWNPDNWGKVVEINSPNITMRGVNQSLIGISNETGEAKLMVPGQEYNFTNTKKVTEYPVKRTKNKRFS